MSAFDTYCMWLGYVLVATAGLAALGGIVLLVLDFVYGQARKTYGLWEMINAARKAKGLDEL